MSSASHGRGAGGPDNDGAPPGGTSAKLATASDVPSPVPFWKQALPNGQAAEMDDTIEGPNVIYHHGALAGRPGLFVDNPSDPSGYSSVFVPSGEDPTPLNQFAPAPEIEPSGERYFDKVVWKEGPRQAVVRVDSVGRPIKAFTLDAGEVNEAAISPFDLLGAAEADVLADAVASVGKATIRPLGEAIADVVAKQGFRGAAEDSANAAEPAFQLGGAHADVRGVPGYESHHMPADSVSYLPKNQGPAIAMLSGDHQLTASWGWKTAARSYRARQADLIQAGDFKSAIQMDIDDIREKFGTKYDDAISQMLEYINNSGFYQ